jgi:membrane-associated phospholipid phosphatase
VPHASSRPRRLLITSVCAAAFSVLTTLVAIRWAPLKHIDLAAERRLDKAVWAHPAIADVARGISTICLPVVLEVGVAVLGAVQLAQGRVRAAMTLVLALLLELAFGNLVKGSVDRPRPTVAKTLAHEAGPSFPSAHALASATIVCAVLLVVTPAYLGARAQRWACLVGAIVVLLVGVSRLVLAVHYPSDVAGGWLLGIAIAGGSTEIITRVRRPARRRTDSHTPNRPSQPRPG